MHTKDPSASIAARDAPGIDSGSSQGPPEVVFLGGIAKTGQLGVEPALTIPLQITPEVRRAVHRDDGDAFVGQVATATPGQDLKRDLVTSVLQPERPSARP